MDVGKMQRGKAETVKGLTGGIEHLFKKHGVTYLQGKVGYALLGGLLLLLLVLLGNDSGADEVGIVAGDAALKAGLAAQLLCGQLRCRRALFVHPQCAMGDGVDGTVGRSGAICPCAGGSDARAARMLWRENCDKHREPRDEEEKSDGVLARLIVAADVSYGVLEKELQTKRLVCTRPSSGLPHISI